MHNQSVQWFYKIAPYINAFKGKTFVIAFSGKLAKTGMLNTLTQDLSILSSLGIQLLLVYDFLPQVNEKLRSKNCKERFQENSAPINSHTLKFAKEEAGGIRLDIEAAFSRGLPNTPMSHSRIRVVSGNFFTAKPIGILNGVDYEYSGSVHKVDFEALKLATKQGFIVLLSPLGFSVTGDIFSVPMGEIASRVAAALYAEKLVFLLDGPILNLGETDDKELTCLCADRLLNNSSLDKITAKVMEHAIAAVKSGVPKVHLFPYSLASNLLLEIFTQDNLGITITEDKVDGLRAATVDDVRAILDLIKVIQSDGTLLPRSPRVVNNDIEKFLVLENNNIIYGCVALHLFPTENMAEMACLVVHPIRQGTGQGERLLRQVEVKARHANAKTLFVLTTRTSHWFIKHGFVKGRVSDLPLEKQCDYNYSRNSLVLLKKL